MSLAKTAADQVVGSGGLKEPFIRSDPENEVAPQSYFGEGEVGSNLT